MKFDQAKKCFVNDDGSRLKPTRSLVDQYPTYCDHSTHYGEVEDTCIKRRVARFHAYLRRELGDNNGVTSEA